MPELMTYVSNWHLASTLIETLLLHIIVPAWGVVLAVRAFSAEDVRWGELLAFPLVLVIALLMRDTVLGVASSGSVHGDVSTSAGTSFSLLRYLALTFAVMPLFGLWSLSGLTEEGFSSARKRPLERTHTLR